MAKPDTPENRSYDPYPASRKWDNPRRTGSPTDEARMKALNKRKNINPDGVLTEKQRKYALAVGRHGLNHAAACREAGIPTASHAAAITAMARNPKVIKAIAEERETFAKATLMTKKRVMEGFLEAIDIAKLQADSIAMIGGWREVAKMCGFYEPVKHKLEVTVNGQVVIQKLQALDDAQLLALADGNADALEGEFRVLEG